MRLSFVGELGWELHIPRPSCVPVYRAVMAAGAKHGLVPAGYRAIDNLSIEKGGHGVQAALVGLPVPPPSPPPTLSISWNPSLPAPGTVLGPPPPALQGGPSPALEGRGRGWGCLQPSPSTPARGREAGMRLGWGVRPRGR